MSSCTVSNSQLIIKFMFLFLGTFLYEELQDLIICCWTLVCPGNVYTQHGSQLTPLYFDIYLHIFCIYLFHVWGGNSRGRWGNRAEDRKGWP